MSKARSKFGRLAAGLLAVVMLLSAVPMTTFAWGYEGEVCSSKYGDRYVGADGEYYYSNSIIDYLVYDDNGNTSFHTQSGGNPRRKMYMVEPDGTERFVYCIESGVDFARGEDTYKSSSGKNSNYFQNLPAAVREGILLTTVYGYQPGMSSPVA